MNDPENQLRQALREVELPADLISRLRAIPDRAAVSEPTAAAAEPIAADGARSPGPRWPQGVRRQQAGRRSAAMKSLLGLAAAAAVTAVLIRFNPWDQQPHSVNLPRAPLQAGQSAVLAAESARSQPPALAIDLPSIRLELATANHYLQCWETLRLSDKAASLGQSSRAPSTSPGFSDAASLSWLISTEMALDAGVSKADATRELQLLVQELPGSQGALRAESLLTQWKLQ